MTDLVTTLRVGYVLSAVAVLSIHCITPLRTRFLNYGARSQARAAASNIVETALDALAAVRVRHSWFISFYATSTACSIFWLSQIVTHGPAFRTLAAYKDDHTLAGSTTFEGVVLAWTMLFIQGSRRLYECIVLSRPSTSEMWVGHWLLGVGFYLVTNVAVWIESTAVLEKHSYTANDLVIVMPNLRGFTALAIFILASGFQHDCHAYLFALKDKNKGKYQLPQHPAFVRIVSPHYTAECLIYLSLAIAAAPSNHYLNLTLMSALSFVIINLGVTAGETRTFYKEKFGPEAARFRWAMLPLIY